MKDFKLTSAGELDLSTNDIQFFDGVQALRQQIEIKLSLFAGEWFLDTEFGTPYFQKILGKQLTLSGAIAAIRASVMEIEEVTQIKNINYTFSSKERKLSVTLDIESVYGAFEVSN